MRRKLRGTGRDLTVCQIEGIVNLSKSVFEVSAYDNCYFRVERFYAKLNNDNPYALDSYRVNYIRSIQKNIKETVTCVEIDIKPEDIKELKNKLEIVNTKDYIDLEYLESIL